MPHGLNATKWQLTQVAFNTITIVRWCIFFVKTFLTLYDQHYWTTAYNLNLFFWGGDGSGVLGPPKINLSYKRTIVYISIKSFKYCIYLFAFFFDFINMIWPPPAHSPTMHSRMVLSRNNLFAVLGPGPGYKHTYKSEHRNL